jgi:radical SAM superfamily enzyme YgiQ (UPF0313 family)
MVVRPLKIFLADLFHDYRPNFISVPLGVGFVGEYCRSIHGKEIDVKLFKSPQKLIDAMREHRPDVIGLSNYTWNVEINRLVRQRVGAELPDTVIVEGGPGIRMDPAGIAAYLTKLSSAHYYTMLEGEWPMADLIGQMLSKGRVLKPAEMDTELDGIAYMADEQLVYKERQASKGELHLIPSPYLSGALDEFLADQHYTPLLETNRGCPFACTFCVWGISALNKVRKFDTDRVIEEIDYIIKRSPATHWDMTDANFGMFPRDVEIARALKSAADESSHLNRISVNWAKNSSKYCTEIAHILRGICDPQVAVQSLDQMVLENVKRSNIKLSTMTDMVEQARKDGIVMTTDVLAGLPGETLQSHLQTLRQLYEIGFDFFNVGNIRLLLGSELEADESREKFALQTKYRYIAGFFGIYDGEPVCEWEEAIVGSNSMSREDMFTLRVVHFLTWVLWNSTMAQPLLRHMFKVEGINPIDAVVELMKAGKDPEFDAFLEAYKAEAREEWFDSRDEIVDNYRNNYKEMLENEYIKLNLKYLAKIYLNPEMAKRVLRIVAGLSKHPATSELVDFCLHRVFFIDKRIPEKTVEFSSELVAALSTIYPDVPIDAGGTCRFHVPDKHFRAIELELKNYNFEQLPERGLAITMQNYGDKLFFRFSFGNAQVETDIGERSLDSFDYSHRLQRDEHRVEAAE